MGREKTVSLFVSLNGEKGFFKEFHIAWSHIRYGIAGALLLCLLLIGFGLDYVFSFSHYGSPYHKENKSLKIKLTQVLKEMELLNSRFYQMEDFSNKVKVIAGLQQPVVSPVAMGPLHQRVSFPDLSASQKEMLSPAVKPATGPVASKPSFLLDKGDDHIRVYMDRLLEKSKLVQADMSTLMASLYQKKDIMSSTPTIMPAKGWISSPFGYRRYPFTGEISLHEGLDIAGFPGSPVSAPGAGVVVFAGYKPGYGKVIVLDHGYQLSTLYGHLSDIMVSQWQKVERGQVMGAIGNTGNSSGPHLHYEVRISNVPVDPANYILNNRF